MDAKARKIYDVRVVRFFKSTKNNIQQYIAEHQAETNICLGHFDYMHTEKLRMQPNCLASPLTLIDKDRSNQAGKEDNYVYPLYLLK